MLTKLRVVPGITTAFALAAFGIGFAQGQVQAQTQNQIQSEPEILHLDLDLTGAEYREMTRGLRFNLGGRGELAQILELGKRNLDWLELINQNRPAQQKLELSTPETQVGYPLDRPRESNPAIIQTEFKSLREAMPPQMVAVLLDGAALTAQIPVEDEVYLRFARWADRVYQSASRWLMQEPNLWAYSGRAYLDIRGYYFLTQEPELEAKLKGWSELDSATQARLRGYLVSECKNSRKSTSACSSELDRIVTRTGNAFAFHKQYLPEAKKVFEAFFRLQNARSDSRWNSDRTLFTVPFRNPDDLAVRHWLQSNVEEEWRFGNFRLILDFALGNSSSAQVVFEPGATPHVNGLGGNTITMDANRSIQEYTTRWTIRHEFGHVLGFPDCYIEFYDQDRRVMVSYQIDLDNLMCSRRGKLQQTHLDELVRAYRD